MPQNKSLSTQEVADILHVSKSTIYDLIKRNEIVSYKIGRKVRFTQEDVDDYISRSRHELGIRNVTTVEADSLFTNPLNTERKGLVISGQDVILDILTSCLNQRGINASRCYLSGFEGLLSFYQGKVDIASCHLYAGDNEEYNLSYLKYIAPGVPAILVNLSYRMQGFYVKKGNPKKINGWEDLKRDDICIVNRRLGSSSRILLDKKINSLGINPENIKGYDKIMGSHLTMASAIASGEADIGLGTERVSKQLEGISFIPLINERYDLAIRKSQFNSSEITGLIKLLRSEYFYRSVSSISGNDYSDIGEIVAEV